MATMPTATAALGALLVTGCAVVTTEPATPTPQRPTLSSDTTTTAAGTWELEAGLVADPGDTFDMPSTVKWGMSPQSELFATVSPYRYVAGPGPDGDGFGDLSLGMRHRVVEETDELPSAAFQVATKLPTGHRAAGSSGELDFFAAAMATKTVEGTTLTGFYQLGILGEPGAPDTDLQHAVAVAAARPFARRASGFGELALVLDPEADREQLLATGGVAYAARDNLVLDAGLSVGLTRDAPDLAFLVGLTINFGHIESTLVH